MGVRDSLCEYKRNTISLPLSWDKDMSKIKTEVQKIKRPSIYCDTSCNICGTQPATIVLLVEHTSTLRFCDKCWHEFKGMVNGEVK